MNAHGSNVVGLPRVQPFFLAAVALAAVACERRDPPRTTSSTTTPAPPSMASAPAASISAAPSPQPQPEPATTRVVDTVNATGRVYFMERKSKVGPKLLAVWRPSWVEFPRVTTPASHGFHMLLHPYAGEVWPGYPFAPNYVHTARRYLLTGMGLIGHHFRTGKKVFIVFPVKDMADVTGDLKTWAVARKIFQDILYFVLRTEGVDTVQVRLHKLGRVAVSAFSFGAEAAQLLVQTAPGDSELKEVYNFDGINMSSPARSTELNTAVRTWLGKQPAGADVRLRIYNQDNSPNMDGNMNQVNPDPKVANSLHSDPVGIDAFGGFDPHKTAIRVRKSISGVTTREVHSGETPPRRSFVNVPDVAWQGLITPSAVGALDQHKQPIGDARRFYDVAHQVVPHIFVHHAIKLSGFDD